MTQLLGANNSSAKIIASLIDRVAHTLWLVLSIPDRPPTPLPTHPPIQPPTHPATHQPTHPPTATSPFPLLPPLHLSLPLPPLSVFTSVGRSECVQAPTWKYSRNPGALQCSLMRQATGDLVKARGEKANG